MKKYITLSFILLLILSSCSQLQQPKEKKTETALIGKWKVATCEVNLVDVKEELIQGVKDEALSTTYVLNEDNTFHFTSASIVYGLQGGWGIIPETGMLQLHYEEMGEHKMDEYVVKIVSDKQLEWSQDLKDVGNFKMVLNKE